MLLATTDADQAHELDPSDYMAAQLGKKPPPGPLPALSRCRCGLLCCRPPCSDCAGSPALQYLAEVDAAIGSPAAAPRTDARALVLVAVCAMVAMAWLGSSMMDAPRRPGPAETMVAQ